MINTLFNDFLVKSLQESLLDNIDCSKYTTCTQYFILMVHTMQHPKVVNLLFNFLFGFSKDEQSETDNTSSFAFEMYNPPQSHEKTVSFMFENQNVDPFEYRTATGKFIPPYALDKPDHTFYHNEFTGDEIDPNDTKLLTLNSSQNRGSQLPFLNLVDNSGSGEGFVKPIQKQNIIVDSSSGSEADIEIDNKYMNIGTFTYINIYRC
jgi:hypothetical protein